MIVVGVEIDPDVVVVRERRIAPHVLGDDPLRIGVVADDPEVEGPLVLDDADFGVLGGRDPVEGRVLPEPCGRHGVLPHRLVQDPVDLDGLAAGYDVHVQLGRRRQVGAVVILRPHRRWHRPDQREQNQHTQPPT